MTQHRVVRLIWVGLIMYLLVLGVTAYTQDSLGTVPKGSWVYEVMANLYRDGLIPNYPNEWVKSGYELSRFEVAYYIKQFITGLTNQAKNNEIKPETSATLQRLIAEFHDELADLGILTADIYKISPNIVKQENNTDGYDDLDLVLKKSKQEKDESYYYMGEYYKDLRSKSFIFIPVANVKPAQLSLLDGKSNGVNIVYHPIAGKNQSYLVVKGNLPLDKERNIYGYYLFPIENSDSENNENGKNINFNFNTSVVSLLDEVNQVQQIDRLWRFEGSLALDGYLRLDNDLFSKNLLGNIEQGLKIGGLLVYTENPSVKNDFELNNFSLPFYNSRSSTPVDLDNINGKYLQTIQINIQGTINLTPQTSLVGGLDLIYRGAENGLVDNSLWPSDTKATAGLEHRMNEYWTLLTYQSFVNSQAQPDQISTTSVGVEYNDWITFWLAYQLLKFDDPIITGALDFRF